MRHFSSLALLFAVLCIAACAQQGVRTEPRPEKRTCVHDGSSELVNLNSNEKRKLRLFQSYVLYFVSKSEIPVTTPITVAAVNCTVLESYAETFATIDWEFEGKEGLPILIRYDVYFKDTLLGMADRLLLGTAAHEVCHIILEHLLILNTPQPADIERFEREAEMCAAGLIGERGVIEAYASVPLPASTRAVSQQHRLVLAYHFYHRAIMLDHR